MLVLLSSFSGFELVCVYLLDCLFVLRFGVVYCCVGFCCFDDDVVDSLLLLVACCFFG